MSWIVGEPVNATVAGALTSMIEARRIMYQNHAGQRNVGLIYKYMTEADARFCVANRRLTGVTSVTSATSPADPPRECINRGLTWFIAVPDGSGPSAINVLSWGKAIGG
ncbi:conserved hypothetical protein [Rhizobium mesoamericanum STM3625]|uniref:Uncharacterized protein n=1 Tax=Rhizobium mesoamericanum STM3625 TaxID=1211777 RepID=K0Q0D5_9HYPH|nr:conserved hypothetical protein [Rhizobium mesoamericanum STM3625]